MSRKGLLRCILQDADADLTVMKKKVVLVLCIFTLVMCLITLLDWPLLDNSVLLPCVLGAAAYLVHMFITKELNLAGVEGLLYSIALSTLLTDAVEAKRSYSRTWPALVVLLDISLVCGLPARTAYTIITAAIIFLSIIASEDSFRWGLYDGPFGKSSKEIADWHCDCDTPPCAKGPIAPFNGFVINVGIFILDFYFTRGFAHGMQKEHEKMEAAINATERIASSLSDFDLTAAEATLSTASLPPPLHEAFIKILGNLEGYRPYLPDALFAQMHSDSGANTVDIPGLVTGRAALVFTDIQGSTATWEACPEGMREGLQVHNKVMRECLSAHGGYEVKTIGDSFMAAFECTQSAIKFALKVQKELLYALWPIELLELDHCVWDTDGPWCGLRVRIGVHCGAVDVQLNPLTGRYDYFGNTVNKAARMEGACVGGAVAVTQEVIEEAVDPGDVTVINMGPLELRGISGDVPGYLLLPQVLAGRGDFVRKQLLLKREDRRPRKRRNSSPTSIRSAHSAELRIESTAFLQHRASATVCVAEVVLGDDDVLAVTGDMNAVLEKMQSSCERTHGTVVSLQGSRVAVSWNGAKPCATHVENAFAFVRIIGNCEVHLGVATGSVVCGTVGGRRQKFVAVLGVGMEVAARLCTDAVQADILCYYAGSNELRDIDALLQATRAGSHHAMLLYEISMLQGTSHVRGV